MTKTVLSSKTIWINVITLLLTVLTAVLDMGIIPAEYLVYVTGLVIPILNVINRFFTGGSIALRNSTPKE